MLAKDDADLRAEIWRRLPLEVGLAIAETASETMLPGTLYRWCLVNKAWHRIASAALYACVVLSPHDHDVDGAWRIQRFCETIVENARLAATVKALDFAVSREECGIANQQQYMAILDRCRKLIYLRNIQRPRVREDTYLLAIPRGAMARLQWHDSDLRGFEELIESVYKPLHFRTNPDARGTVRTDVVRTDAQSASRLLRDLRLLARLPDVRNLPTGFFRRMAAKQLPQQKVMLSWCTKNYQNDRPAVDVALGTIRLLSRILPKVELIELYVTDCDFHFSPCPSTYSRASSTGLPCLYPRSFWDYVYKELLTLAPLPFAVAVYHVLTPDLGYVSDAPGIIPNEMHDFRIDQGQTEKPDFPYDEQDDRLDGRASSGHGWQQPLIMLPLSAELTHIKLKDGYRSLPFCNWKPNKPAWDVLVNPPREYISSSEQMSDAQDCWDIDTSLGNVDLPRRPRASAIPKRGSLDWLRLVRRNLEHDVHDMTL